MYHATRPAPAPPSSLTNSGLPPHHPFATYCLPPSTPFKQSYHASSRGYASTPSTASSASSRSTCRSATSYLSAPLSPSPSRPHTLGHVACRPSPDLSRYHHSPSVDSFISSDHPSRPSPPPRFHSMPAYSTLPSELSLFDPRPKQTLLEDLEVIAGKKLSSPVIKRAMGLFSGNGKWEMAKGRKDDGERKGRDGKSAARGRKLRKERWEGDGDEWMWDGVVLIEDEREMREDYRRERKGRGVREGNFI